MSGLASTGSIVHSCCLLIYRRMHARERVLQWVTQLVNVYVDKLSRPGMYSVEFGGMNKDLAKVYKILARLDGGERFALELEGTVSE